MISSPASFSQTLASPLSANNSSHSFDTWHVISCHGFSNAVVSSNQSYFNECLNNTESRTFFGDCSLQCLVGNQPQGLDPQVLLHPLPLGSSPVVLQPQLLVRQRLPLVKLPLLLHQLSVELSSQPPMALQQAPAMRHLLSGGRSPAAENDRLLPQPQPPACVVTWFCYVERCF